MNFKKIIILWALVLCTTNYNILAMETVAPDMPMSGLSDYIIAYILEFLYQPNSAIPDSYTSTGHDLVSFALTSKRHRLLSLQYTEDRINSLIKFDKSTETINLNYNHGADLIAACCAFKIISKIREVGVDDPGKNFCERQFQELIKLGIFHTSFKEICLKPIHWLISKMMEYNTDFFSATQNTLRSPNGRITLITQAYLKGEDVNSRNDDGVTALQFAVTSNQLEITQMLLSCGASVDAVVNNEKSHREFNGFTALHIAVLRGFTNIASALLLAGANAGATINNPGFEYNGYSPLHIATRNGSHEIILELVHAGANINARIFRRKEINGCTPLHIAARKNDLETVRLLLALGANPTLLVRDHGAKRRADELTTNPDIQHIIQAACDALL